MSKLFDPIKIRGEEIKNRSWVSPMCQYSCEDGYANNWHMVHLGSRAVGGAGLVMSEAAAVEPEGRISPWDLGIWKDEHIEPLKEITKFISEQGSTPAIQLAHAGRKASAKEPWKGGLPLDKEDEEKGIYSWKTVAPSSIALAEGWQVPKALEKKEIDDLVLSYVKSAKLAIEAGFQVLEIHAAHGYLLHSFLSPIANKRNDEYGGSLNNRMRFGLEVVESVRTVWPEKKPLFFRISSVDGAENGTKFEENISYARELKKAGVDIIDCSSGGIGGSPVLTKSKIIPGFQVPYSERIKKEANINTMAVGAIIEPDQAEDIITNGRADLIAIGRELLADTQWVYKAATKFGLSNSKDFLPDSYSFFLSRRDDYLDRSAKPA